jgi:UDP-N-acetylglucosamine 1-carboxyvinyltransferase
VRKFIITESIPLHGKVKVSGAKNSALPIMAASLLSSGQSVIEEVPERKMKITK